MAYGTPGGITELGGIRDAGGYRTLDRVIEELKGRGFVESFRATDSSVRGRVGS